MNNDDICIHCKRTLEYHIDGRCFGFKSISQHYAELRGPENLKVMEKCMEILLRIKPTESDAFIMNYLETIGWISEAIEASKPPKE